MKTLKNLQTTIKDGKVTITGDLVEQTFSHPVQQVTVGFAADKDIHWIRHVQLSHEALFVKRIGAGFAINLEELVNNVANIVEPKLSFPPKARYANKFQVDITSELEPTVQWQVTEADGPEEWRDIPGQTKLLLDSTTVSLGQFVRCKTSNGAGCTYTPIFKV